MFEFDFLNQIADKAREQFENLSIEDLKQMKEKSDDYKSRERR